MPRLQGITLSGRHVSLEPLRAEHAADLLAAASPARGSYAFTIVPSDLDGMKTYISNALSDHERGVALPFVVRDAAGTIAGSTRFLDIEYWTWAGTAPEPVPAGPDTVEIGFTWYAERVQRTALNTEAKLLLCTLAFETWRVRRVTWKTDSRNERSRNAILRLGAKFDGVLRAHRPGADGVVRDTAFFSMLAAEWPGARDRLSSRLAIG